MKTNGDRYAVYELNTLYRTRQTEMCKDRQKHTQIGGDGHTQAETDTGRQIKTQAGRDRHRQGDKTLAGSDRHRHTATA